MFIAGKVAEIEDDGFHGSGGGVVGEVGVGFLDEGDLGEEVSFFEVVAGGFDGGGLDVEGDDFPEGADMVGEECGVVAIAGGGIDDEVAGGNFTLEEGVEEGGGMGRKHGGKDQGGLKIKSS